MSENNRVQGLAISRLLTQAVGVVGLSLIPLMAGTNPAFAGIESMMGNLQSAILNVLAPMICVGGIIFAGFKLAMGDESAKRMLFWSCVGTVITFTAPSILSFLQTRVAS
ncbi:TrbC/VirB2 family protein [Bdellovibrionota bacterium FG-1]